MYQKYISYILYIKILYMYKYTKIYMCIHIGVAVRKKDRGKSY